MNDFYALAIKGISERIVYIYSPEEFEPINGAFESKVSITIDWLTLALFVYWFAAFSAAAVAITT